MKLQLIVVGKTTSAPLQGMISDYTSRLKHYIPFEMEVIPELKNTKALTPEQQKTKEGEAIRKEKISLSKMTFSHQMVRLFFVEQCYRAMTILKGEPYHHE